MPRFASAEFVVMLGAYLTFAFGTWAGLTGLLPYPAVLIINGFSLFYVFTPLHDAVHRSASSDPRLNDLIGNVCAFLLAPGITTRLYRWLHDEHHRNTGEKVSDPDEPFVSAPWVLRVLTWVFPDIHWLSFYFRHRHERPEAERRGYWLSIAFSLSWHAAWLLSPWAWEFFIYWMIPQRLGLTILIYLFGHIQHPVDVEHRHNPFQATRMIRGGVPMRIFMLGQSTHLMHHIFPSIPFYRYHKVWELGRTRFEQRPLVWTWPFMPRTDPSPLRKPNKPTTLRVHVIAVDDIAQDVRAYLLRGADRALAKFAAGAHIDVHVKPQLIRQYSLCSNPNVNATWRIAVKRETAGRGGSIAMHKGIEVGDVLEVSAPRNHFPLRNGSGPSVLVAGGIGVTPILAMAFELHRQRRPFEMHLCARNADALPFRREADLWPFAARLRVHLDDGPAQDRLSDRSIPQWRQGTTLYLCGPSGFMNAVISMARERGWPDQDILTETFVAPALDTANDQQFEVELRRSGKTLTVPAAQSLLDTLQAHDIGMSAICAQGICGACTVTVLEGDVDHRDRVLGDRRFPKGCLMTTCVSRARKGRLVLDL